jgi:hypothetical protein
MFAGRSTLPSLEPEHVSVYTLCLENIWREILEFFLSHDLHHHNITLATASDCAVQSKLYLARKKSCADSSRYAA